MIKEMHDNGVPRDEIIKWVMKTLRTTRKRAEFIIDIELGVIDGDIVYVTDELSPVLPL
jgi:hypothetical protein